MCTYNSHKKIRINTYYLPQETKIKLYMHYDRELCDTIEEYQSLSQEYI